MPIPLNQQALFLASICCSLIVMDLFSWWYIGIAKAFGTQGHKKIEYPHMTLLHPLFEAFNRYFCFSAKNQACLSEASRTLPEVQVP